ncbi:hypothetical protein NXS19_002165 [Fusarium pseudograminearum]|nr:hypothetical protein NXS19_002165 [Fusarium pseudograminearum]
MHLTEDIEAAIGYANHRRNAPVLFPGITISLNNIHHKDQQKLKRHNTFKNIRDSLNSPSDDIFAKIYYFSYMAFLISLIAYYSGRKQEALERVTKLKDAIRDNIPRRKDPKLL